MLVSRGYDAEDPVARAEATPELVVGYLLAARDTAERAEVGSASRNAVEAALDDLRAIFDLLAAEHP